MERNSEITAAANIYKNTAGRFLYVSGYKTKESVVKVRCSVCGGIQERTYHHLTTAKRCDCGSCKQAERSQIKREREQERRLRDEERLKKSAERKRREEERRASRETPHPCPVCGSMTTRQKYCSHECREKAHNKTKEIRRRNKIADAMIDRDISVMGLFKRDLGVCHICGGRCNVEDFTIIDGTFIAGDWYPSIDHIVPLAKGGLHSWGNVKLAHRRCNSIKSDK